MKKIITTIIILVLIPAISFAGSAKDSKRLFKEGKYQLGVLATDNLISNQEISGKTRAEAYYWRGKNQIANGNFRSGVSSMIEAIRINPCEDYTDEFTSTIEKLAGKDLYYLEMGKKYLTPAKYSAIRTNMIAQYIAKMKQSLAKSNVKDAVNFAKIVVGNSPAQKTTLFNTFVSYAEKTTDNGNCIKAAAFAAEIGQEKNEKLGQKLISIAKEIEKEKGPFASEFETCANIVGKFTDTDLEEVEMCEIGKDKLIKIMPGEITTWYDYPQNVTNYDLRYPSTDFIVYLKNGKQVIDFSKTQKLPNYQHAIFKFKSKSTKPLFLILETTSSNSYASR